MDRGRRSLTWLKKAKRVYGLYIFIIGSRGSEQIRIFKEYLLFSNLGHISYTSNPSFPELDCTCPFISYVINLITQTGHILVYRSISYSMRSICRTFFMSKSPERVLLQSHSISALHLVPALLSVEVSSYSSLVQRGAQSGRTIWSACTTAKSFSA